MEVNRKLSRVTVSGYVEPKKVLKRVKSTGKRAEYWPYIPYNLVSYPYVTGAYDKRAPTGFVRNVAQAIPPSNATDNNIVHLFSDDNAHACSIMWFHASFSIPPTLISTTLLCLSLSFSMYIPFLLFFFFDNLLLKNNYKTPHNNSHLKITLLLLKWFLN